MLSCVYGFRNIIRVLNLIFCIRTKIIVEWFHPYWLRSLLLIITSTPDVIFFNLRLFQLFRLIVCIRLILGNRVRFWLIECKWLILHRFGRNTKTESFLMSLLFFVHNILCIISILNNNLHSIFIHSWKH